MLFSLKFWQLLFDTLPLTTHIHREPLRLNYHELSSKIFVTVVADGSGGVLFRLFVF